MPNKKPQPTSSKRFHIHRVRKDLYRVTDTVCKVQYQTRDPKPFRETQQVVVRAVPKKEIDLGELARVLLKLVDEQDNQMYTTNMEAFEKIQSNPASHSIYEALTHYLDTIGKYTVEKKKSSLHIVKERAFLGVHPRSNGLLINIVTDKPIKDALIHKTEQVSANRYHNEVIISDPSELNKTVLGWISEAYQL